MDDLVSEISARAVRGERVLVTTLTKKMAEDLSDYLREVGVRTHHLHSEQDTFERVEILRELAAGRLRCGRWDQSAPGGAGPAGGKLSCGAGRRQGGVSAQRRGPWSKRWAGRRDMSARTRFLYAERITDSMRRAMDETQRRRKIQGEYNTAHGITPAGIQKAIRDISDRVREAAETADTHTAGKSPMPRDQIARLIRDLEQQMKQASKALEFEQAALLRDQIVELRRELAGGDLDDLPQWSDQSYGRRGRRPLRRRLEPSSPSSH